MRASLSFATGETLGPASGTHSTQVQEIQELELMIRSDDEEMSQMTRGPLQQPSSLVGTQADSFLLLSILRLHAGDGRSDRQIETVRGVRRT